MQPQTLREGADPSLIGLDVVGGVVIGLALWLVIIVAAPIVVLLLAAVLLSVELPVVAALAVVLIVLRFAGIGAGPWSSLDVSGGERRETNRNLLRALRRIRAINADRGVQCAGRGAERPRDGTAYPVPPSGLRQWGHAPVPRRGNRPAHPEAG